MRSNNNPLDLDSSQKKQSPSYKKSKPVAFQFTGISDAAITDVACELLKWSKDGAKMCEQLRAQKEVEPEVSQLYLSMKL